MATAIKKQNSLVLDSDKNKSPSVIHNSEISIDPQVKAIRKYKTRRSFDTAYKVRILSAYDACETASERGSLLRKEGLYLTRIYAWKKQLKNSKLDSKQKKRGALRVDHLTKENEQLKKKLAQAEAIIDIQKKISELLGIHVLPDEKNESK